MLQIKPIEPCSKPATVIRALLLLTGIAALGIFDSGCARRCTKTLAEAPEVQGFHLGSQLVDLQIRFPGLTVEQRPFGESRVKITVLPMTENIRTGLGWAVVNPSRYPELADNRKIILRLVDDQLADAKIYYDNEQQMDIDQFLVRAKSIVNITDGWQRLPGLDDAQVQCDKFLVEAGMDRGENLNEEKLPYIELVKVELLAKLAHTGLLPTDFKNVSLVLT